MTKAELDYILETMLESQQSVSDLNITVDKPLQVESSGELMSVAIEPHVERLTPFQTETMALNIISRNRRLTEDLIKTGSCDCSYGLGAEGPVPRQCLHATRPLHGHSSKTIDRYSECGPTKPASRLPHRFERENGARARHGRNRKRQVDYAGGSAE